MFLQLQWCPHQVKNLKLYQWRHLQHNTTDFQHSISLLYVLPNPSFRQIKNYTSGAIYYLRILNTSLLHFKPIQNLFLAQFYFTFIPCLLIHSINSIKLGKQVFFSFSTLFLELHTELYQETYTAHTNIQNCLNRNISKNICTWTTKKKKKNWLTNICRTLLSI